MQAHIRAPNITRLTDFFDSLTYFVYVISDTKRSSLPPCLLHDSFFHRGCSCFQVADDAYSVACGNPSPVGSCYSLGRDRADWRCNIGRHFCWCRPITHYLLALCSHQNHSHSFVLWLLSVFASFFP